MNESLIEPAVGHPVTVPTLDFLEKGGLATVWVTP
jgi:hypothetical protein